MKVEYIDCACRSEVIRIENITYDEFNEYSTDCIQMSIYRQRYISFWDKLKLIWLIIKTGEPYADDVILTNQDVDKLIKILTKIRSNKDESI